MKTFLVVHLGLAPLIVFWVLLGFASPGAAVAVGLAASIALGRLALRPARVLHPGGRQSGDLSRHGRPRPRGAGLLRRRGAVAVLRRPRPHRAGQRRAAAAVDRRLFARRVRRRIGEPAVRSRQHADFRPLGGAVPGRRAGHRLARWRARDDRPLRLRGAGLDLRPESLRPRDSPARDRSGRALSLAGPRASAAPRATAQSTSRWSAPGSAALPPRRCSPTPG